MGGGGKLPSFSQPSGNVQGGKQLEKKIQSLFDGSSDLLEGKLLEGKGCEKTM